MVLNHDVELLEDGKAKVASQSSGQVVYYLVNGECSCKDYAKAPSNWCKHRIAAGLYKRATALVQRKLGEQAMARATAMPRLILHPRRMPHPRSNWRRSPQWRTRTHSAPSARGTGEHRAESHPARP